MVSLWYHCLLAPPSATPAGNTPGSHASRDNDLAGEDEMAKPQHGRFMADLAGHDEVVVFLIGIRPNSLWKVRSWWLVAGGQRDAPHAPAP